MKTAMTFAGTVLNKPDVKTALEMCIIDRANREDRATLKGLVDRVTK